ncbi:response regulator transcription factor [Cohnella yongneupensis]|uniref:Response regulator n=1 Tax=Cohnella yongneupensis TaxID=425006 RepID=A0ABW0R3C2_9BACL
MINALLVDDEKLVRKGFISMTDWSSYDIRFVGEAKDGHTALALLGKTNVDLLFVDISMPGMTGFELMEQVRTLYPQIKSVVLTCHHEFDYVQEALRLGAIDYIVKTLLNRGNVDETMTRILKRLSWESREAVVSPVRTFQGATAFCTFEHPVNKEALLAGVTAGRKPIMLTDSIWLQPASDIETADGVMKLPLSLREHWQPIKLAPSAKLSQADAEALIVRMLPGWLFYGASPIPQTGLHLDPFAEDAAQASRIAEADKSVQAIELELEQMKWLFYGKEWKQLVDKIEATQPPPASLIRITSGLAEDWSLYFDWESDAERKTKWKPEQSPQSWKQVRSWLSEMMATLQRRMVELTLSREVVVCLLQAMAYMKRYAASDLNQNVVAKQVGMSRSYFSQCYKKFTGVSFGDTLRMMKLEQAKELLNTTDLSVYEVSSRIGFEDDKHFSRVFRERTGYYPTEYRMRRDERS